MTVPRKPKGKPNSIDETARVQRIWEWLSEWADQRWAASVRERVTPAEYLALLAIADRIASRTED